MAATFQSQLQTYVAPLRDKLAKSYNSSFRKWAYWCDVRDKNPISGDSIICAAVAPVCVSPTLLGCCMYTTQVSTQLLI